MMHRETSGFDASGAVMPKEEFDQVLVFTHLKLHNQSKNPVFLRQILTNVTLGDGIHSSYAATPSDYERLFAAYPDLASLHGKPLALDATVPRSGPGWRRCFLVPDDEGGVRDAQGAGPERELSLSCRT